MAESEEFLEVDCDITGEPDQKALAEIIAEMLDDIGFLKAQGPDDVVEIANIIKNLQEWVEELQKAGGIQVKIHSESSKLTLN